jgi:hypothetical protein
MAMKETLEKLKQRESKALEMGGLDKIARKQPVVIGTALERVEKFPDLRKLFRS